MNNTQLSIPFKQALLILIFSLLSTVGFAQKLPKIQEISMRIPGNSKIDGKTTEWDNKFQAYNNATQVFYTIANDDDKLYLAIQVTDQLVIRKIIAGSITFTINLTDDKKNMPMAITYPIFDKKHWPNLRLKNKPVVTPDSTINSKQVDSFRYAVNQQLADKALEIKISGIKGLPDTLSVYNQEGIRAVSLFDHQIAYNYELAVPLKYLGLSVNSTPNFKYSIKLNGSNNVEGVVVTHGDDGSTHMQWYTANRPTDAEVNFMEYPTDLSGNYTLTKK